MAACPPYIWLQWQFKWHGLFSSMSPGQLWRVLQLSCPVLSCPVLIPSSPSFCFSPFWISFMNEWKCPDTGPRFPLCLVSNLGPQRFSCLFFYLSLKQDEKRCNCKSVIFSTSVSMLITDHSTWDKLLYLKFVMVLLDHMVCEILQSKSNQKPEETGL